YNIGSGRRVGGARRRSQRRDYRYSVSRRTLRVGPRLGRVAHILAHANRPSLDQRRSSQDAEIIRFLTKADFKIKAVRLNAVGKGQAECVVEFLAGDIVEFIPVCVQHGHALLETYRHIIFQWIKGVSRKVTHVLPPHYTELSC